jgi:ABC-type transport system involved in multi-copper enzyme maturation permease subunit
MGRIRIIKSIVKADFFERTRSYGFLITIAISLLFTYVFVPHADAKYAVVMISGYRGIYNSAWIGATVAMSLMTALFLLGYFLVKGAIDRDRQTGVGQIIATTPTTKFTYLSGKFLSNFLILTVIVFLTFVVAVVMQLVSGESDKLNFADLILPFFLVVLPAMAVVAALAILFESVGFLKGGIGNIIYFFFWAELLNYENTIPAKIGNLNLHISSLMGIEVYYDSMIASFKELFPNIKVEKADGFMTLEEPLKTFVWNGIKWDADIILGRLFWALTAFVVILAATLLFKGFDRSTSIKYRDIFDKLKKKMFSKKEKFSDLTGEMERFEAKKLTPVSFQFSFFNMTLSELKLTLRGQKLWWYLIQAVLIIACVISSISDTKSYFGPLSWCWPILVWSSMGVREARNRTNQLVFSSPFPLRRQFPATWLSGFIVALLTGSGMLIKFLMAGEIKGVLACLVGAMFIPTLAFTLGIWTRTSKTFEVVFLTIMFVGLLNNVKAFDFIGVLDDSIASGVPIVYLVITIILALIGLYGRKRQIKV